MPLVVDALVHAPGMRVTPWARFPEVWRRPPRDLARAGAYVVGLFDELPPTVDLAPDQGEILYVGETHGPGTSLHTRLWSLAYTIGVVDEGHWGHVAGHGFNARFPSDEAWEAAAARLAVAPVPFDMGPAHPPDLRGVMPLLAEKLLLAAFVAHHGRLPPLNAAERVVPPTWAPSPPADVLADALSRPLDPAAHAALGRWLAEACVWNERVPEPVWSPEPGWRGWKVVPKRGWSVWLGRTDGADHLDWGVWGRKDGVWARLEPGRELRTPRDACAAACAFQYGSRTQFDPTRWW